ncbi:MAG TPA: EF-hand domain-containing protein [Rhodanobacteraceae bacterium]|nr:EF-hand domain-containing protein [Rhodanobacteraceae bacterium]
MNKRLLLPVALGIAIAGSAIATPPPATSADAQGRAARAPLDSNGDGYIDRSEAAARPMLLQRFEQIDANHDDKLGRDELRQARADARKDHMHKRMQQREEKFAAADTDHDGNLSLSEFEASKTANAEQRFQALDQNQDGKLSREELDARGARMRHHRDHDDAQPHQR